MDPESPESLGRRCVFFFCPHDCVAVPAAPLGSLFPSSCPLAPEQSPQCHVEQASHTLMHKSPQ